MCSGYRNWKSLTFGKELSLPFCVILIKTLQLICIDLMNKWGTAKKPLNIDQNRQVLIFQSLSFPQTNHGPEISRYEYDRRNVLFLT